MENDHTNDGHPDSASTLYAGFIRSGMSHIQLWANYLSMGGELTEKDLATALQGSPILTAYEHNMVAQVLNDHFIDPGQNHPVLYFDQLDQPEW